MGNIQNRECGVFLRIMHATPLEIEYWELRLYDDSYFQGTCLGPSLGINSDII